MSKIRVTSNPMQSGRNGASTYYISNGTQIVRPSRNNSNYGPEASRSPAQQLRRIMWANLVNIYKVSSFWMPRAFENAKGGQSDYNIFMQLNMDSSRIALTKQEAALGACVIEDVKISLGNIPSISHLKSDGYIVTSISIGTDPDAFTTVANFSKALIENNPQVYEGMQLSFIYYLQTLDAQNTPRIQCFAYEVTLDTKDTERLVVDLLPSQMIEPQSGSLAVNLESMQGACCFIWSDTTSRGKIRVSSQSLVSKNDYLIEAYGSTVQYQKAMESYGVDVGVFLQSGYYKRSGGQPVIEVLIERYLMVPYEYNVGTLGPTYDEMYEAETRQGLGLAEAIPAGEYEATLEFIQTTPSIQPYAIQVTGTVADDGTRKFLQFNTIPNVPALRGLQLGRATFTAGVAQYTGWWLVRA